MHYPEHDKLDKIKAEADVIAEFLRWATTRDCVFGREVDADSAFGADHWLVPLREEALQRMIAEFFGIKWRAFLTERDQMSTDRELTST